MTLTQECEASIAVEFAGCMPAAFPASFARFCRLVVRAKDVTNAAPVVRQFLREAKPGIEFGALAKDGIVSRGRWMQLARCYREWNAKRVSASRVRKRKS